MKCHGFLTCQYALNYKVSINLHKSIVPRDIQRGCKRNATIAHMRKIICRLIGIFLIAFTMTSPAIMGAMIFTTVFHRITSPIHMPFNSQNSSEIFFIKDSPLLNGFIMPPYLTFNKGINPPKSRMNNTPRKLTLATFFVLTSLLFFSTFLLLLCVGFSVYDLNFGM